MILYVNAFLNYPEVVKANLCIRKQSDPFLITFVYNRRKFWNQIFLRRICTFYGSEFPIKMFLKMSVSPCICPCHRVYVCPLRIIKKCTKLCMKSNQISYKCFYLWPARSQLNLQIYRGRCNNNFYVIFIIVSLKSVWIYISMNLSYHISLNSKN